MVHIHCSYSSSNLQVHSSSSWVGTKGGADPTFASAKVKNAIGWIGIFLFVFPSFTLYGTHCIHCDDECSLGWLNVAVYITSRYAVSEPTSWDVSSRGLDQTHHRPRALFNFEHLRMMPSAGLGCFTQHWIPGLVCYPWPAKKYESEATNSTLRSARNAIILNYDHVKCLESTEMNWSM